MWWASFLWQGLLRFLKRHKFEWCWSLRYKWMLILFGPMNAYGKGVRSSISWFLLIFRSFWFLIVFLFFVLCPQLLPVPSSSRFLLPPCPRCVLNHHSLDPCLSSSLILSSPWFFPVPRSCWSLIAPLVRYSSHTPQHTTSKQPLKCRESRCCYWPSKTTLRQVCVLSLLFSIPASTKPEVETSIILVVNPLTLQ